MSPGISRPPMTNEHDRLDATFASLRQAYVSAQDATLDAELTRRSPEEGDLLDRQLVKRALFPRRADPVRIGRARRPDLAPPGRGHHHERRRRPADRVRGPRGRPAAGRRRHTDLAVIEARWAEVERRAGIFGAAATRSTGARATAHTRLRRRGREHGLLLAAQTRAQAQGRPVVTPARGPSGARRRRHNRG